MIYARKFPSYSTALFLRASPGPDGQPLVACRSVMLRILRVVLMSFCFTDGQSIVSPSKTTCARYLTGKIGVAM
jgi:hypothetical protein